MFVGLMFVGLMFVGLMFVGICNPDAVSIRIFNPKKRIERGE